MVKNGNGTFKWIAGVLVTAVIFISGALLSAENGKIDTVKTDHEKLIEKNCIDIKANRDSIVELEKAQVRVETKLEDMDKKLDALLGYLEIPMPKPARQVPVVDLVPRADSVDRQER